MLSNGDEVHAQTRARGNAQAVDSILRNPAFLDFCKGATITKITVRGTGTEPPPDNNRFAISRRGDDVTAVDLDERLKVVFKVGDYNSNTVNYFGDGTPDPTRTAQGLRLLADWLQATHPELL